MEETNLNPETIIINSAVQIYTQQRGVTEEDFETKRLEIQNCFRETSRKNAQTNPNLPLVQLSTTNPRNRRNQENFDRDKIVEFTRNLEGDILLDDIFTVAKQQANQSADRLSLDDENYNQFVQKHSKFLSLIGPAGSGKTTLSSLLVQKLLFPENNILSNVEYLFYIKLHYVNYDDKFDILQFLSTSVQTHIEPMSKDMLRLFVDDIAHSSKCVFIFDGLDNVKFNLTEEVPFVNIYDAHAKAEVFIKNIFSGKVFPKSIKLVTSQNYQLVELHPSYRPYFNVYILGLNRQGISEVCHLKAGEHRHRNVMAFLETNPTLLDICFLPVYCNCLMGQIKKIADGHGCLKLHSTTSLMLSVLTSFCRSKHMCSKEKYLGHLTQLAFNGIIKEKLMFEKGDLIEVGINWKNVESFLDVFVLEDLGSTENIIQGDVNASFFHFAFQELFCAIHIMSYLPYDQFKTFMPKLTEKKFQVIAKFLYGMGSKTVRKQVKTLFGTNFHFLKKRDYLINYACEKVKNIKKTDLEGPYLFSWLKEMDEAHFVDSFIPLLPARIGIMNNIYPEEILSYYYLLRATTNKVSLFIGPDFMDDCCSKFLSEILNLIYHKLNIEICWLRIRSIPLTTDDVEVICSCLGRIRELWIEDCDVTNQHIDMLKRTRRLNTKKTKILGIEDLKNDFPYNQSFRHSRRDLSFRDGVISREGSRRSRQLSREILRESSNSNCVIS